uniref:Uncharacterized protein n=1 Tax=Chromera velia CCMP2878 TaxID=1169474 RepID=A0A0G4HU57_9ALVE|eukprot:Cvel_8574.t1-p1 / transcript=Cvel_8574.t1 / gene=Cvel_8574 / organism=Chromera_velia_CCMP2878 / gene_product=hypothetical protein / transcript_product=hypothetical protein / location=Cvel_scaffold476:3668-9188(-) / protein_length=1459 / sequence_SO=supercontig / SO=protein_coding / is_pseudo=false
MPMQRMFISGGALMLGFSLPFVAWILLLWNFTLTRCDAWQNFDADPHNGWVEETETGKPSWPADLKRYLLAERPGVCEEQLMPWFVTVPYFGSDFGDRVSLDIGALILGVPPVGLRVQNPVEGLWVTHDDEFQGKVLGVGTVLNRVRPEDVVAGAGGYVLPGFHVEMFPEKVRWVYERILQQPGTRIAGVRGPHSCEALAACGGMRGGGVGGEEEGCRVLSDPVLFFLPLIFPEFIGRGEAGEGRERPTHPFCFLPHAEKVPQFERELRELSGGNNTHKMHLILSTSDRPVREIAKQISSCGLLVTSHIYGLVFADALGVRSAWVWDERSRKGAKEIWDYLLSVRNFKGEGQLEGFPYSSLDAAIQSGGSPPVSAAALLRMGKRWIDAFPFQRVCRWTSLPDQRKGHAGPPPAPLHAPARVEAHPPFAAERGKCLPDRTLVLDVERFVSDYRGTYYTGRGREFLSEVFTKPRFPEGGLKDGGEECGNWLDGVIELGRACVESTGKLYEKFVEDLTTYGRALGCSFLLSDSSFSSPNSSSDSFERVGGKQGTGGTSCFSSDWLMSAGCPVEARSQSGDTCSTGQACRASLPRAVYEDFAEIERERSEDRIRNGEHIAIDRARELLTAHVEKGRAKVERFWKGVEIEFMKAQSFSEAQNRSACAPPWGLLHSWQGSGEKGRGKGDLIASESEEWVANKRGGLGSGRVWSDFSSLTSLRWGQLPQGYREERERTGGGREREGVDQRNETVAVLSSFPFPFLKGALEMEGLIWTDSFVRPPIDAFFFVWQLEVAQRLGLEHGNVIRQFFFSSSLPPEAKENRSEKAAGVFESPPEGLLVSSVEGNSATAHERVASLALFREFRQPFDLAFVFEMESNCRSAELTMQKVSQSLVDQLGLMLRQSIKMGGVRVHFVMVERERDQPLFLPAVNSVISKSLHVSGGSLVSLVWRRPSSQTISSDKETIPHHVAFHPYVAGAHHARYALIRCAEMKSRDFLDRSVRAAPRDSTKSTHRWSPRSLPGPTAEGVHGGGGLDKLLQEHAVVQRRYVENHYGKGGNAAGGEDRGPAPLVYVCPGWGECGGNGDRVLGILTVFLLALLSRRPFFICSRTPTPLPLFLRPASLSSLDWTSLNCNEWQEGGEMAGSRWVWGRRIPDKLQLSSLAERLLTEDRGTLMSLTLNWQGIEEIVGGHSALSNVAVSYGLHLEMNLSRRLFRSLFVPSDALEEAGLSMICHTVSESLEETAECLGRSGRATKARWPLYLALHVRLGRAGETDPVRIPLDFLQDYLRCARSVEAKVLRGLGSQRSSSTDEANESPKGKGTKGGDGSTSALREVERAEQEEGEGGGMQFSRQPPVNLPWVLITDNDQVWDVPEVAELHDRGRGKLRRPKLFGARGHTDLSAPPLAAEVSVDAFVQQLVLARATAVVLSRSNFGEQTVNLLGDPHSPPAFYWDGCLHMDLALSQ